MKVDGWMDGWMDKCCGESKERAKILWIHKIDPHG
jgi:hypothetical protein